MRLDRLNRLTRLISRLTPFHAINALLIPNFSIHKQEQVTCGFEPLSHHHSLKAFTSPHINHTNHTAQILQTLKAPHNERSNLHRPRHLQ